MSPIGTATAAERLAAWKQGRTGYPLVDAGMRQMITEGWMHNRVRMVVASFLIKDLHIGWQHGAAFFMERLRDGDTCAKPPQLAVGRRFWDRSRAVLPDFQPDHPEREVRPGRYLHPPLCT